MEQIQWFHSAAQAELEVGPAVPFGSDGEGIKNLFPQKLAQACRNAEFPQARKASAEVDFGVEGPLHEVRPLVSYRGYSVVSNRARKRVSNQKSSEGRERRAAQDRSHINPTGRCVEEVEAQRKTRLSAFLSIKVSHFVKSVPIVGLNPGELQGGRMSAEPEK